MEYRSIKRCGNVKVSEISLGCEGFIGKSEEEYKIMLDKALALGINFIDMYTPNPTFRINFGKAMKGRREKLVIQSHLCSVWENDEYLRTRDIEKTKAAFEEGLKLLDTDYIDIGMIHYVDSEEDWDRIANGEIIEYCKELKANGKIRAIGLSSHNPVVARKAVESGLIDVLMFSVNAAYDLQPANEDCFVLFEADSYKDGMGVDPDRKLLYEVCEKENVAINVMKAFGGGDMLDASLSPFGVAFNEYQCIEYCLTRPSVVAVMAGCHTIEEMEKVVSYYQATKEEKDYASVLAKIERFNFSGNCMYCGHCAPCTVGINVAEVNKYLNLCLAQGMVPETVADHYKLLEHHASECIECGRCESNCPFGVSIIEKMRKAKEIFGY
ncbi:MAG: aldo/keto reductase [Erysipelotrichales bacterium]|nr:aldo/keto reductase [Erysipelotrichales bacterium]